MNILEQHNKELYHYGVKGMKWGVRRAFKKANKNVSKSLRNISDLNRMKSDVLNGNRKARMYGYTGTKESAQRVAKGIDKQIKQQQDIGKKWLETSSKIRYMSDLSTKDAKIMIAEAKRYTNNLLFEIDDET